MSLNLSRREVLLAAAAVPMAAVAAAEPAPVVIDTHTHFYDPTRPQGVPWPGKGDPVLDRPVLPPEFRKLSAKHGVTGTVVVEASPWVEDNQWLLDLAKEHPVIVGVVGRLLPADPEFARHLKRFAKNPLFRGIRINQNEVKAALENRVQLDRLQLLSDNGLSLDVNGGPALLQDVVALAEKLPKLRVVINHLANVKIDGKKPPEDWRNGMKACAGHEQVWCKLSALVEGSGKRQGNAPKEVEFYRPVFDVAWSTFGAARLIYGSNWPVSDIFAAYQTVFELASSCVKSHGAEAFAKVFGTNAQAAYRLPKS